MSGHTPGPWGANHPSGYCKPAYGPKAGAWKLATPRGDLLVHSSLNVGEPEHEANARLIAAAPDMLAALENLTLNAMSLPRSNVAGCINVDRNDIERAREAIAKAKGTP